MIPLWSPTHPQFESILKWIDDLRRVYQEEKENLRELAEVK
jgi:hypothetical protein